MLEVKTEFYFPSLLLKLILFTDISYSSKEDAVSEFRVAGWWYLRGEGGTENKKLWKGCFLSPHPLQTFQGQLQ